MEASTWAIIASGASFVLICLAAAIFAIFMHTHDCPDSSDYDKEREPEWYKRAKAREAKERAEREGTKGHTHG